MFKNLPRLLLILGILTLINTGIASLSGVFSVLTGPPSAQEIKKQDVEMAKFIQVLKEYDTSPEAMELVEKLQFITKALNENYVQKKYIRISSLHYLQFVVLHFNVFNRVTG